MALTQQDLDKLVRLVPEDYAVYRVGETLQTLAVSRDTENNLGYSPQEYDDLVSADTFNIIFPADRPFVADFLKHSFKDSDYAECTYRILHKQKGFTWVHAKGRRIDIWDGDLIILVSFINTSHETEMDETMRYFPTGVSVFRKSGEEYQRIYANAYFLDLFGIGIEGVEGKSIWVLDHIIAPEDIKRAYEQTKEIFVREGPLVSEFRVWNKDAGTWRWVRREGLAVPQPDGSSIAYASYTDITRQKEAEAALEESRERYEQAIRGADLAVWEYDIRAHRITSPDRGLSPFGVPDSIENVPVSMLRFFDEKSRDALVAMYADMEAGKPTVSGEFWAQWKPNMPPRCEKISYSVVFDEAGEPVRAYGVGQDITAERLEKQSYERSLEQLLAANPQALCSFRLNLTRDTCESGHGSSGFIQNLLSASSVDQLYNNIASIIANPREKTDFRRMFNRKHLLELFAQGERDISMTYRRRMEDGATHWATSYVNMVQNPTTMDIIAVVSSVDSEDAVTEERITQLITDQDYEYIGLIYRSEYKMRIRFVSSRVSDVYRADVDSAAIDYDIMRQRAVEGWIRTDDAQRFMRNSELGSIVEQLKKTDRYMFEIMARGSGEGEERKQLHYSYLDDSKESILVLQRDITDLYRAEQERQRELTDQIAREQALKAEAMRANALKSSFLSNVSHDMRTPLNGIIGYTDLALENERDGVTRGYLQKVRHSSDILLQLINDTLDLNKIETGAITLKPLPVDARALIERISMAVQPSMDAKDIRFHTDFGKVADGYLVMDALRVQEIFLNLLSNAVKFTPEGGRIDFIVTTIADEGDRQCERIVIRDNGVGISQEFLPHVFEAFTQERTEETSTIEGSGLGLSIVKSLVEMMGGTIEVESVLGKGTTFTIDLAFERTDRLRQRADESAAPDVELDGRRMLLVEDNPMNTEIARMLLERWNIEVEHAVNGHQGVQAFSAHEPGYYDAVLMDIRMPVMDGYEATQRIRALDRPDAKTVPIIAMTADAYDDDVRRSFEVGMNAHVSKPIDREELRSTLERLVRR